jgi:hypothetical protein
VGSLIYITTTRIYISYFVGIISKFLQSPFEGHCSTAKVYLKYLKGGQDFGLKYSKVDDFNLIRYSDSYFVGDKENGVSNSGYLIIIGSTIVS